MRINQKIQLSTFSYRGDTYLEPFERFLLSTASSSLLVKILDVVRGTKKKRSSRCDACHYFPQVLFIPFYTGINRSL